MTVIATVYRLHVVIATPRIELGEFRCNAGLIEICVPDAAQGGHVDCGFRLPQSMAVEYCSIRVSGPDDPTRPSDLPTSLTSLYSLVRSLSCRKEQMPGGWVLENQGFGPAMNIRCSDYTDGNKNKNMEPIAPLGKGD